CPNFLTCTYTLLNSTKSGVAKIPSVTEADIRRQTIFT
ncbi:MAG: hypothetical protein ACI9FD_004381, partial [Gammaproteobacteria bacterium]